MPLAGVLLGREEIMRYEGMALDGSQEAARKLFVHYQFAGNADRAIRWGMIAIENGSREAYYGLAYFLHQSPNQNQRRRAYYLWNKYIELSDKADVDRARSAMDYLEKKVLRKDFGAYEYPDW